MRLKVSILLVLFIILTSCGTLIGPYLSSPIIKNEYVNKNKAYIFGYFKIYGSNVGAPIIGDYAENSGIVLVIRNISNKREYRIQFKENETNFTYGIEVEPGTYKIEEVAFLIGLMAKNFSIYTNSNSIFTVNYNDAIYIGDYTGSVNIFYESADILSHISKKTYIWKIEKVENNYKYTKKSFMNKYPMFSSFIFKSIFDL